MAKQKKDTKKDKKQSKKTVDTSLKDIFVAEAQDTTFTEEDVKELEETRQQAKEEEIAVTEPVDAVDEQTTDEIVETPQEEEVTNESVEETVIEEVTTDEAENVTDIVEEEMVVSEEEINQKDIPTVKEEKPTPKKRITTKEAYGYHWMGLIYDE